MLLNEHLLSDDGQQFMILERWGGLDNAADYTQQAQSLRRSLDSIEYVEKAYAMENVVTMHKPEMAAAMVTIVSVDSHAELDQHVRRNVAHARMASADREVLPLVDWDAGRTELVAVIRQLETLAAGERLAADQGEIRPFTDER